MESCLGRVPTFLPKEFCENLSPNEFLWTNDLFDCITLEMIHSSFNHTAELFNKIYNRSKNNEFIGRTLDDIATRNGDNIRKDIKKIAEKILTDNNFDCETGELIGRHTSNKFKALPYIDDVDNKTREDATLFINEHNTQFPDRKIDIS